LIKQDPKYIHIAHLISIYFCFSHNYRNGDPTYFRWECTTMLPKNRQHLWPASRGHVLWRSRSWNCVFKTVECNALQLLIVF